MREIKSEKFIELVEATNKIEAEALSAMVNKFKDNHSGLLLEIVDKGYLRSDFAGELWARSIGSTFVDPMSINIALDGEETLPLEMARKVKAIPLYEFNGYITLAIR